MKINRLKKKTIFQILSLFIFISGITLSIWVYFNAAEKSDNIIGYETINGVSYPVFAENSKKYMRSVEQFSGKAGILMNDIREWFENLWYGKSLAFVIGLFTIALSFIFYKIARNS